MAKLKIGISIDPALLERVDAVAGNREESRSSMIERAVEIGIEQMESTDRQMENPFMRAALTALSKPKILETLAAIVGRDVKSELGIEAAEAHKIIVAGAARGKKRQSEKRAPARERELKGA